LLSGVPLPLSALRAQIASAIDVIVQVIRGRDGRREIVDIAEVERDRVPRARSLLESPPRRPARRRGVDLHQEWRACER
jgi:Flp pilus assembly CpaF family ATPase